MPENAFCIVLLRKLLRLHSKGVGRGADKNMNKSKKEEEIESRE